MPSSRRGYRALQHILNWGNQLRGVSETWGEAEDLYARLAMERIQEHLAGLAGAPHRILDGGCGLGGMAIELAGAGHRVTGIEVHGSSVSWARRRAAEVGVALELVRGDLLVRAKTMPTAGFDAILCVGVLYTCADYREIVAEFSRLLRPGGLLLATFRPPYYFVTTLLRQGKVDQALAVTRSSEGVLRIARVPSYYNWQTEAELTELYEAHGFEVVEQRPIGTFSGTGYDGMAAVADAERIEDPRERAALFELEKTAGAITGAGRFTLVVGRKR
jgi:2-polyprenyl-3-methyl-5-hydroxy-6-metoxy-1,4-benzoquinol methylase